MANVEELTPEAWAMMSEEAVAAIKEEYRRRHALEDRKPEYEPQHAEGVGVASSGGMV